MGFLKDEGGAVIAPKYRTVNVFLLAVAVGVIAMQQQITEALLPFVPEPYRALAGICIALLILGVREVVKEYGQNTESA